MKLVQWLQQELFEFGVRQIYGIPGDFVLPLFNAIEQDKLLPIRYLSHEPSAVFAADAAARLTNKPSVVALTYGAGALNGVNAVAQSFMEHVPLVVIAGFPSKPELERNLLIHHQAKTVDSQRDIYREITACQVRLDDPVTATEMLRHALVVCAERSLPVLIEVPRDAPQFDVTPIAPHQSVQPDSNAVETAALALSQRIDAAQRPVVLAGVDVRRFDAVDALETFVEKANIPIVSTLMGRACLDAKHPCYRGIFLDKSDVLPAKILADADLILLVGVIKTDSNFAAHKDLFTAAKTVEVTQGDLILGEERYTGAPLRKLLQSVTEKVGPVRTKLPTMENLSRVKGSEFSSTMAVECLHQVLSMQGNTVPIVSDVGDCLFASLRVDPKFLLAPAFYASMGYAIPAALGVQTSTGLRPVVLVGDGAFRMTGLELGHSSRLGCSPIVLLFNNNSWDMIKAFSPELNCTDLGRWDYVQLAEAMGGVAMQAQSVEELTQAIRQALTIEDNFVLIEIKLAANSRTDRLNQFAAGFLAANAASC